MVSIIQIFRILQKVTNYGIGKVFRVGEYVTLRDTVDDSREWLLETTMVTTSSQSHGRQ